MRMERETKSGVRRRESHDHNRQVKLYILLELQDSALGVRDVQDDGLVVVEYLCLLFSVRWDGMERVSRRMFIGIEAWLQGPGRVGVLYQTSRVCYATLSYLRDGVHRIVTGKNEEVTRWQILRSVR
jgi:hypothetical protein